jgi:hypothetical protein
VWASSALSRALVATLRVGMTNQSLHPATRSLKVGCSWLRAPVTTERDPYGERQIGGSSRSDPEKATFSGSGWLMIPVLRP